MAIKRVQIKAQDLVLGMFISGLDRPWSQTPFPLQGFHISRPKDIDTVKSFSTYVYIDVTKGRKPSPGTRIYKTQTEAELEKTAVAAKENAYNLGLSSRRADVTKLTAVAPRPIELRVGTYEKTETMRIEAGRAANIVRELKGNITLVSKQIAKGKLTNVVNLQRCVDDMVASVLRCPDAFNWLLRLRHKDQHNYDHSLRSAMLTAQFGRYAGMSKADISILVMASLLKDVGKVKISKPVLVKKHLTGDEEREYQRFVQYSVDILKTLENLEPKVITAVRYHCERQDGSGFPHGIAGGKIPVYSRIIGIACEYDGCSNPRGSSQPVAPSRAVSLIYNMRDQQFQEDLVVKFIQSIGLYPTGTLVELTSGDMGIVLEQDPGSKLTPTVAVLDQTLQGGELGKECTFIDLKDERRSRQVLLETGRDYIMNVSKLAIARDLEPSAYDVDYNSISTAYVSDSRQAANQSGKAGFFTALKSKLFG